CDAPCWRVHIHRWCNVRPVVEEVVVQDQELARPDNDLESLVEDLLTDHPSALAVGYGRVGEPAHISTGRVDPVAGDVGAGRHRLEQGRPGRSGPEREG